jgi:hypothetical protein
MKVVLFLTAVAVLVAAPLSAEAKGRKAPRGTMSASERADFVRWANDACRRKYPGNVYAMIDTKRRRVVCYVR